MDGRGSLAQPLTWIARLRARPPTAARPRRARSRIGIALPGSSLARIARRAFHFIVRIRLPRGAGLAAALSVVIGAIGYGIIKGDHAPAIIQTLKSARDEAANSAGFRLVTLRLSGDRHVT